MGILRSLGALGRAVGPIVAASGKRFRLTLSPSGSLPFFPSYLLCSDLAPGGERVTECT